jgi:hypothetical protein
MRVSRRCLFLPFERTEGTHTAKRDRTTTATKGKETIIVWSRSAQQRLQQQICSPLHKTKTKTGDESCRRDTVAEEVEKQR